MQKKPIIGIIGRTDNIDGINVIQMNENYRLSIIKSGGLPIIIVPVDSEKYNQKNENHRKLNNKEKKDLLDVLSLCDGILITGGTRWHEFDEIICNYAIKNNIPILGICLGMQIMSNMDNFCGTLESDQTIRNDTILNHFQENTKYIHRITLMPGILEKVLKDKDIMVNSRHNYHSANSNSFKIEAYSEDNLIEAISIPDCDFAIGVQWHPEDMIEYDNKMLDLFKNFIKSCNK